MSTSRRLANHAKVVLALNVLYNVADALCSVFVGVYFYIHSLRFEVVCYHYLTLYAVTPVVYLLAGWYAQRFDRLHVFRVGVAAHGLYYGLLLWLQEAAPAHAISLGAVLGVAWGLFWAGNNTFNYDVVDAPQRDHYFGWLNALTGASRFGAPIVSAVILHLVSGGETGYYLLFTIALGLYLLSIGGSFLVPRDSTGRPFRLARALFPGRDQRDWRLVMLASATQAGSFHIFYFLLGLAMYMNTGSAATVGIFTSFQYLAGIAVSFLVGRLVTPETRKRVMGWAALLLLVGGFVIAWDIQFTTLVIFGFLRSMAEPMYMIPYSSVRLDIIDRSVRDPAERIEYMCASEVPLAVGRVLMMALLLVLSGMLDELGLRIALFILCFNRILTFLIVSQTSELRRSGAARN